MRVIKCDICGSIEKVETRKLPVYRTFDSCDGQTMFKKPHIDFQEIDICEECLLKATNIYDRRVMGFGEIRISPNPELTKTDLL
jgi:hypothetical protein